MRLKRADQNVVVVTGLFTILACFVVLVLDYPGLMLAFIAFAPQGMILPNAIDDTREDRLNYFLENELVVLLYAVVFWLLYLFMQS